MTQVITTPDGVEHEFPDGASDDVIKKALGAYSQGPGQAAPNPKPGEPGNQTLPWFNTTQYSQQPTKIGAWLNTAIDTGTMGAADWLQGKLNAAGIGDTNKSTEQLRTDTQNLRGDIGPLGSMTADLAGYAVGPGKLKVGAKLAELAGGKLAARVAGSAAENAATSGASSLIHGEDVGTAGKQALVGGSIGALTGALPSGSGQFKTMTAPATDELKAAAQVKFTPLENTWINSRNTAREFSVADNSITPGSRTGIGDGLQSKIDEISNSISNSQVLSADDLAKWQRQLMSKAQNPQDREIAGRYVDALDKALGPHAPAVADANRATNIAKTSRDIEKWAANPETAPKAVAGALAKRPGLYQSQPGLFDALSQVGQRAKSSTGSQIGSQVSDEITKRIIGGAIGGTAGYLTDNDPYATGAGAFLGGVVAPKAAAYFRNRGIANQLDAARHLTATGQQVSAAPVGDWLGWLARQTGYGVGAAGRPNYQP